MIVRELVALFGFQVDQSSVKNVQSTIDAIKSFAAKALVVGGFVEGARALIGFAEEVANVGDNLMGMSAQLGVSAKDLQEFGFIAEMANVSSEEMAGSLKFLSKNSFEAANGNKELAGAFKKLHIDVKGANGATRPASDLLLDLSDAFAEIQDPAKKTALAVQLLGKSGTTLIPFLSQGSAAIREQRKELSDLGAVMSDELIAASDEFSDNQTKMQKAVFGLKIAIGSELIPILNKINGEFIEWFKQNGATIRKALADVAEFLGNILLFVSRITTALLTFITNLDGAQKALLAVAAAAGILIGVLSAPAFALGAFIAALLLIIEDFSVWQEGGESLIGHLVDGFNKLADKFSVFKAVKELFTDLYKSIVLVKDVIYSIIDGLTELGSKRGFWNTFKEGLRQAGEAAGIGDLPNNVSAEDSEKFKADVMRLHPEYFIDEFRGPPYAPSSQITNHISVQVDARGLKDAEAVAGATVDKLKNSDWNQRMIETGQNFKGPPSAVRR